MVFVAFGLPGELVRVELVEQHERWARGVLVEVLKPAPERIEPRCLHFGVCGGCHYQHMPYPEQLRAKREIVADQLRRIGGLPDAEVRPTIASPHEWNYRNHMQFHLDQDGNLAFVQALANDLFPVQECHLPIPSLDALWPQLDIEPADSISRIALRGFNERESLVIFHGQGQPQFDLEIDLPASVVWMSPEIASVLAGDGHLTAEVLGRTFIVSAGSFFQVNSELTPGLVEMALEALAPEPGQAIYDLYAGVGLFSAFMAQAGAQVIAIEESAWGARDYELNLDEFDDVILYESTVEDALPYLEHPPDSILVDPPRAGLGRELTKHLADLQADRFVYVSCDPATLARDAKALADSGYQLQWVQPLDLFPQTYHIETVSLWLPARG